MANPRSDMRVTHALLAEYAEKYKNWGKWGDDDEIGTLNYTSPEDIIKAAQLVKKGKVNLNSEQELSDINDENKKKREGERR